MLLLVIAAFTVLWLRNGGLLANAKDECKIAQAMENSGPENLRCFRATITQAGERTSVTNSSSFHIDFGTSHGKSSGQCFRYYGKKDQEQEIQVLSSSGDLEPRHLGKGENVHCFCSNEKCDDDFVKKITVTNPSKSFISSELQYIVEAALKKKPARTTGRERVLSTEVPSRITISEASAPAIVITEQATVNAAKEEATSNKASALEFSDFIDADKFHSHLRNRRKLSLFMVILALGMSAIMLCQFSLLVCMRNEIRYYQEPEPQQSTLLQQNTVLVPVSTVQTKS